MRKIYIATICTIVLIIGVVIIKKQTNKIEDIINGAEKTIETFNFNDDQISEYLRYNIWENKIAPNAKIEDHGIAIEVKPFNSIEGNIRKIPKYSYSISRKWIPDELCAKNVFQVGFIVFIYTDFHEVGYYQFGKEPDPSNFNPILNKPGYIQTDTIAIVNWITKELLLRGKYKGGPPPKELSSDKVNSDGSHRFGGPAVGDAEIEWIKSFILEKSKEIK